MNRTRDISSSELMMIRQAVREMNTDNFTRIGLDTRENLLEWLEGVDKWKGGRVTIVRND